MIPSLKQMTGVVLLSAALFTNGFSQTQKTIHTNYQFWTSINTIARVNKHWAVIGDVHIRRNHFAADPGFYFVRTGAGYYVNKNFYVVAGYGHMWLASEVQQHYLFAGENRIYEQAQYTLKFKKAGITQRIRNEQRWQQKIVNGKPSAYNHFSDRIRYLLSISVPVFKNENLPVPVISDEAAVHFGRDIIYNRFDQNRIFLGIKQKISKTLSFDFGYMNLYQNKYTRGQADDNHTFRLFFYYNPHL